jgi:hypothetical protein
MYNDSSDSSADGSYDQDDSSIESDEEEEELPSDLFMHDYGRPVEGQELDVVIDFKDNSGTLSLDNFKQEIVSIKKRLQHRIGIDII